MSAADCTIVVERLGEARYRARCLFIPDCEAIAATAEAARAAVELALDRIVRERERRASPLPHPTRGARPHESD
jgi:hypothetical protein